MTADTLDLLLTYDALLGLALVTVFAGGAWLLRGVTIWGALAGYLLAFTLFLSAGRGGFAVLVTVFVITFVSTRLGYRRKQALGMAEHARGRGARQVAANLAAAVAFSLAAAVVQQHALLLASMAALAEAAADTASSECGEALGKRAYLLTTFRPVPVGTDGGLSAAGTLAGVLAACMVAVVAAATHVVGWPRAPLVAGAGILGTLVDSLLGATLERWGVLNNNGVNFLSTLAAALIAFLLAG